MLSVNIFSLNFSMKCIHYYFASSEIVLSLSTVVLNSRNLGNRMDSGKFCALKINLAIGFTRKNWLKYIGKAVMMLYLG